MIGTPGRLSDLVTTNPDALSLRRVKYTIFDEADELMDVDWEQQMAPILTGPTAHYTDSRQYLMFSATFNREAREAAVSRMIPIIIARDTFLLTLRAIGQISGEKLHQDRHRASRVYTHEHSSSHHLDRRQHEARRCG